jgi:transposase
MDFLRLRSARLNENELCAVDSTSRAAYGDSLADIRWGKNKENLPLEQTNEVVVYSLSSHMPIYYRTFPGNMPDCSSLDIILSDLKFAGFKNLVFITDRGYDTIINLEKMINDEHSLVMCAKTRQKEVAKIINSIPEFGVMPEEMEIDSEQKLYYRQYDIDYEFENSVKLRKETARLKVNLYFDPIRRCHELIDLEISI